MARRKLGLEQRVAARIKSIREELGLSQADLARLAGTSRSYVSEIEWERKIPSIKLLGKFADALGVQPEQLVAADSPKGKLDAVDGIARRLRKGGPAHIALVRSLLDGLDKVVTATEKGMKAKR